MQRHRSSSWTDGNTHPTSAEGEAFSRATTPYCRDPTNCPACCAMRRHDATISTARSGALCGCKQLGAAPEQCYLNERMQESHAIALPCGTCGAPLPIDLGQGHAKCGYCGSDTAYEPSVLERAREHLTALAALEAQATSAAAEADLERRRRRLGCGILTPLVPLMVGLYIILALGIGASSQFVVRPALAPRIGEDAAGIIGAVLVFVIWGALAALPLALIARARRVQVPVTAAHVALSGCPRCGAMVPVLLAQPMVCPFCASSLTRDAETERRERQLVDRYTKKQKRIASNLRRAADASGAAQNESVLRMVLTNQLAFIVLGIVISILIGIAKLLRLF